MDSAVKGPGQRNSKGLFGETEGGLKKAAENEREKLDSVSVHLCWLE